MPVYQDINSNFKSTSTTLVLSDEEVINQALNTLFSTPKGSRMFNREYGSSLENFLFEGMTPALQDALSMIVFDEVKRFEPRVVLKSLNNVNLSFDYDNNMLTINIFYNLKGNESISGNFIKSIEVK